MGLQLLPVRTPPHPTLPWPPVRSRRVSFSAVLCLLLTCVIVLGAIHLHPSVGPLESAPLAPHHCLLCLAAHLPVTISLGPVDPLPRLACAGLLPLEAAVSYESAATLALYIRPPPQA